MIILEAYSDPTNYQDPDTPQVYGTVYRVDTYDFDEVNETVAHRETSYDDFQNNNPPAGYSVVGEFFARCAGTTRRS